MASFIDVETDEILTLDQLKEEYEEAIENGYTEAETFSDYLQNCLEGTLERI